jgi:hypothetical protein
MAWHRIDQGFDARQDGDEGQASSGDIKATGAVAQQAIPVGQPAERALHHPPPGDDDKALGRRSRSTTGWRMPCRFDQAWQRSAVKAPS